MLLPNEWIENSIETYIYQHTTKSQVIYWVVLAAITATIIALPFVYVDISVQGGGVVRPVTEKTEIKAAITEYVDSSVRPNLPDRWKNTVRFPISRPATGIRLFRPSKKRTRDDFSTGRKRVFAQQNTF